MFLRKMKSPKTLTFKLTTLHIILYLLSFILFTCVAFVIVYKSVKRHEIDIVNDEIQEIVDKSQNGTFEDLVRICSGEILELGSTNLLIHINYHNSDYFLPDKQAWEGFTAELPDQHNAGINIPRQNRTSVLRLRAAELPSGAILYVGYISTSKNDLIEQFIRIFSVIFIPLLVVSTAIGYFMVRRSLTDISLVRRTAVEIYRGNLNSRVQRSYNGDELDQLSEAFNTMLSRINFLIKNMAAMVDNLAHDLRTPLTRIKASAEIALMSDRKADFYQELLEKSLVDYDHIIKLINHVLSISEAESGVAPLHLELVNLKELSETLHEFYAPMAVDLGIDFVVEEIDDVFIHVDKPRFWQCLCNILDNAFKFTGEGGRIWLTAKSNGMSVSVSISDTGIGIAEDALPYIFERFFKVDQGGRGQGYGLGLNLSRAIVAMHGGKIEVHSLVGKGTTFSIILPRQLPDLLPRDSAK
jgi:signal transduction histidine kinase